MYVEGELTYDRDRDITTIIIFELILTGSCLFTSFRGEIKPGL